MDAAVRCQAEYETGAVRAGDGAKVVYRCEAPATAERHVVVAGEVTLMVEVCAAHGELFDLASRGSVVDWACYDQAADS